MIKVLNKVLECIMAVMICLMVFGCVWQIVARFILRNPSDWTEEFVRYVLIWLTMLGVPYAYGQDKHISIGFVTSTFSKKGTLWDKIFIEILVLVLSVGVLIIGGLMVTLNAAGQTSAALHIPVQLYYGGVPVCGVLMVIYVIPRLLGFIKEAKNLKEVAK